MRMPGMTGSPPGRAVRALLTAVAALALLLVGAMPASAHDEVVATTPTAQESLATPPSAVELELTAPPQVLGTVVRVTGPDGSVVSEGDPEVLDTTVRQPLAPGLPAGGYTVDWRVTSGDGHAITGSSTFTVATGASPVPAAPETAPGPAPEDLEASTTVEDAPASEASASAPAGSSSSTGLVVGGALLVLLAAGLVLWRLRRQA